jgi:hypothetical protein
MMTSIDYNKIFQKLKEKCDFVTTRNLTTKKYYPTKNKKVYYI